MQYLLTQDEYDKLADSKAQARAIADDFKRRVKDALSMKLSGAQHFDYFQRESLRKIICECVLDTPVVEEPKILLDKKP
jgi:hypothetical protein